MGITKEQLINTVGQIKEYTDNAKLSKTFVGDDVANKILSTDDNGNVVLKNGGSGEGTGTSVTVDTEMSDTSENPIQNKVIKKYVDDNLTGVQTELADVKKELGDGMTLVADAITAKGVETATNATLEVMAGNIRAIEQGVDTSDATATAIDIMAGKTAYVNGVKITGIATSSELHGATISVSSENVAIVGTDITLLKDGAVVGTRTMDENLVCSFSGIQDPGDYTVSASDGTDSISETVTISSDNIVNKTVLSCVLFLIPDGSSVTPVDDVAVWLKCAGSKAGYTNIAEVLADSDTMFALTSDENAMKYLERSTSFADGLCSDETFMAYLGQSPYVESTVLNSDLWVEKLKESPYKLQVSPYQVCSYSTASDSDLKNMLDGYYNGWLTIDDIKTKNSVGDTRSVSLSAMSATGVGESHRAQTVQFVIGDFEHDDLTTAINGHTKAAITLTQVDCLMDAASESNPENGQKNTEDGYMNSTNTNVGGWDSCARRIWCNNVYYNALPSGLKSLVKAVNKLTSEGNQSTTINTTSDNVFLPSEIEIYGSATYSVAGEGKQYSYYSTISNRYKNPKWANPYISSAYWERSSHKNHSTAYCNVDRSGNADFTYNATNNNGLAPCLCI